mmetsp:Transcript_5059/g.8549  ORF Transcript_5059/g.8549 Transcript_5059/m.8549 type:complete len:107 (-) Transcript_5059:4-324(-)
MCSNKGRDFRKILFQMVRQEATVCTCPWCVCRKRRSKQKMNGEMRMEEKKLESQSKEISKEMRTMLTFTWRIRMMFLMMKRPRTCSEMCGSQRFCIFLNVLGLKKS